MLSDIGRNNTATSIIGDHAMRLNQVLIDHGAQESLDCRAAGTNDFTASATDRPTDAPDPRCLPFRGYLEDELAHGMNRNGSRTRRPPARTAELFTLPLDFIDTGGLGEAATAGRLPPG